ncbi:MAG: hypothetical protein MJZ56_07750 [Bacteroidales bacterium]|nr:hypothetical protein [Bacteroidales bacterium]
MRRDSDEDVQEVRDLDSQTRVLSSTSDLLLILQTADRNNPDAIVSA